jgi:hypothetical protein
MNNKYRIIAYLQAHGKTSRLSLEQALSIGDVTTRIAEINKEYRAIHGRNLIKAFTEYEINREGKSLPVGYYELDAWPVTQDLFTS